MAAGTMVRIWLAVMAVGILFDAATVQATKVPKLSMEQLMARSGLVFVGRVVEVDPNAGEKEPLTRVTFAPMKVLKGAAQNEKITFYIPGGAFPDGTFMRVLGSPVFIPEETYLVFVRAGKWHLTPVTNWYHSVFWEVSIGGKRYLASLNGRAVVGVDDSGFKLGPIIARPPFMRPLVGDKEGSSGPAMSRGAAAAHGGRKMSRGSVTIDEAIMTSDDVLSKVQTWVSRVKMTVEEPIYFRPASLVF